MQKSEKDQPIVQNVGGPVHQGQTESKESQQQQFGQKNLDPTLEFFNKLVGQNKFCLMGRTGVKVSRVCLGSMNFGEIDPQFGERPGQFNENDAHKILDRYFELGGNCIDTANFFPWFGSTAGKSEEIIGNWLKDKQRDKIFLMTKIRLPTNDPTNVNSVGLSRNNIFESVNDSLKRLQTNYIDLLFIDGWDSCVSTFDLVRHLDDLVKSDKVRYIGCCDLKAWQLQKLIDYSKQLGAHKPVCYEGEYNLLTRGCELEVADVCLHERIGFFAYSPTKYGFIREHDVKSPGGDRYKAASGDKPLSAMATPQERVRNEPVFENIYNCCQNIAKKRQLTPQQVCLLWTLHQNFVTSVIVGVKDVQELEEYMTCINNNLCLEDEDILQLNEVANFIYAYPYNSVVSHVGRKLFYPTPDIQFEQLTITNANLESYQSFMGGKAEYIPFSGKSSEIMRSPSQHEGQRYVQQPEMKQKQSQIEETIKKSETVTPQRT